MIDPMFGKIEILNYSDIKSIVVGIITGIISSVIVSILFYYVQKIKDEKKELKIAVNEYVNYVQKIVRALKKFYNEKGTKECSTKEIEELIDNYPCYIGFRYTDSNALKEMKDIIDNINFDIINKELNAKKTYKYIGKLQSKVFELLEAKFKFKFKDN